MNVNDQVALKTARCRIQHPSFRTIKAGYNYLIDVLSLVIDSDGVGTCEVYNLYGLHISNAPIRLFETL